MTGKGPVFVLVDGHSMAYRAFYALPPDLKTSTGQLTNAVFGFTSMLIKLLEELKPTHLLVAFDKGKPEFRLEKFEDYKAHRKPMPDELREQLDVIKAVLESMEIPVVEVDGYEADDVIATLVESLPEGSEVYVVTGDRDALQLVRPGVKVVATRKGITDIVVYDEEKVRERFGIGPEQVVDYLALKGDASDNIPGVEGIGEKTAARLLQEFGSLDGIYSHLDRLEGGRWGRLLAENREMAYLSRELANLRRDAPVPAGLLESARLKPWDREKVSALFSSLEFRTLYRRLENLGEAFSFRDSTEESLTVGEEAYPQLEVKTALRGEREVEELLADAASSGSLSLYPNISGEGYTEGRLAGLGLCSGSRGYWLDFSLPQAPALLGLILKKVPGTGAEVCGFRVKDFMVQAFKVTGVLQGGIFDVQLAAYLVDPSAVSHDLESCCSRFLGQTILPGGTGQLSLLEEREAGEEEMERALAVMRLRGPVEAELGSRGLSRLFHELESPLQGVLAEMEISGIRIDTECLREMERDLDAELSRLEREVHELAGHPFNLNSPQQLSQVLFQELGLEPIKKTKTGYATDVSVLMALRDRHPIVDLLLRYRELSKLKGTYVTSLLKLVNPATGKLHTCFNQTVTATGRLSSSNPNLQNIPIRTESGRNIRKAFLPDVPGGSLLSADYSQIELRVLAHLSEDEALLQAFASDTDIHAITASEIFGIPPDQVNPEARRKAKAVNFGIIYGISPQGLGEQIGVSPEEAASYIEAYFRRFPRVKEFLDRQVARAASQGYVTTLLGRIREVREILEDNVRLRRLGERIALNTPIQGSAADIIKVAMLRVHDRLKREGLKSRLVLQVHDELLLDVTPGEEDLARELVKEEMERAFPLKVPLKVDISMGPTWYDAK